MHSLYLSLILFFISIPAYAQVWQSAGVSNVGVNSTNPGKQLDVSGDMRLTGGGKYFGDGSQLSNIVASASPAGGKNAVQYNNGSATAGDETVFSFNGTNIGIGTTNGTSLLDVRGTATATSFSGPLSGNATTATTLQTARAINGVNFDGSIPITVTADANTLTGTTLNSTVVTSSLTSVGILTTGTWKAGNIGIGTTQTQVPLSVMSGNVGIGTWAPTNSLIIKTGNVGIGTDNTPQSLYVAGTMEGQAFKLNQNPAAGNVLVSSAVGVGTWMPASTLPISSGSASAAGGTNAVQYNSGSSTFAGSETVFSFNGTNIGIGTTNGLTKLDVRGGNVGVGTTSTYHALTEITGDGSKELFRVSDTGQNDTTPIVITSSGNLGVGTSTATTAVSVTGTVNATTLQQGGTGVVLTTRNVSTTAPIAGGGDLSADRTITCNVASGSQPGCLSSSDWTTFNNKGTGTVNSGINFDLAYYNGTGTVVSGDSNVYTNGTNVGIGTYNFNNALDIFGGVGIGTEAYSSFMTSSVPSGGLWIEGNLGVGTTLSTTSALTVMNGNVGIGTWKPTRALDVVGAINATSTIGASNFSGTSSGTNTGDQTITLTSDVTGSGTGTFATTLASTYKGWSYTSPVISLATITDSVGIGTTKTQGGLSVMSGNIGVGTWAPQASLVIATGNVGIDTTFAPNPLYVAGTAGMQGFQLYGNGVSAGFVLTTNSVGVGTWVAAPSSSGGSGTINSGTTNRVPYYSGATTLDSSTKIFNDNTNVGIGTINPRTSVEIGVQTMNINGSNVGIGSITPGTTFDVNGAGRFLASGDSTLQIGGGNIGIATTLTTTSGFTIMNGNVGIGTWKPTAPLQVNGTNNLYYSTNVGIGTSGSGSTSCLCKQFSGGICISIGTCT